MGTLSEAPKGNENAGEKIFKTKCAYCHTVEKSAGHKHGLFVHPHPLKHRLSACAHFSISFFPSLASCLRIRGNRSPSHILKLGLWHRKREKNTHTVFVRILADVKPIF